MLTTVCRLNSQNPNRAGEILESQFQIFKERSRSLMQLNCSTRTDVALLFNQSVPAGLEGSGVKGSPIYRVQPEVWSDPKVWSEPEVLFDRRCGRSQAFLYSETNIHKDIKILVSFKSLRSEEYYLTCSWFNSTKRKGREELKVELTNQNPEITTPVGHDISCVT
jgi:hypothetical protein